MTEQQRPDEDVEGHMGFRREDAADDVEGHRSRTQQSETGDEEDAEGHRMRLQQSDTGDDDDVEGHSPARRPL
ncbi:MAG TPA: hypothetical protein VJ966_09955 [Actinomycetes bacterium]|nr:hypothetical protein [Actinomycetes bacterium]